MTAVPLSRTPIIRRDKDRIVDQQCLVCGTITKEFHFGAVCCVACGAFFRRAVSEKRVFVCKKGGRCEMGGNGRAACRACRYHKCIMVGMDPNSVQPPRTANGKAVSESDSGHESSYSPDLPPCLPKLFPEPEPMEFTTNEADLTSEVLHLFETKAAICSSPDETNTVNNFMASYIHLLETRKLLYGNGSIEEMIGGAPPRPRKVPWYHRLSHQALKTENALIAQMLRICCTYNGFKLEEKVIMFKNYSVLMSVLEKYLLTMKNGGIDNRHIYHIDGTYTNMDDPNMEFPPETSRFLDRNTLYKLFIVPHLSNLKTLCVPMSDMGMTEIDLIGLMSWCLFDPDLPGLPLDSRFRLDQARARIHRDWISFYELHGVPMGQLRIARCLALLPTANAIAERLKENYHLFRVFGLFEFDEMLSYIYDDKKTKPEPTNDHGNGKIAQNGFHSGRQDEEPLYQLTFL